MIRRLIRLGLVVAFVLLAVAVGMAAWEYQQAKPIRQALYDAVEPVNVTNCELERFGSPNDGGYLLCGNLLKEVQVVYSYGINGTDDWGCQASQRLNLRLHQYDCFNTQLPSCNDERSSFHPECVGPEPMRDGDLVFDSIAGQVAKNGDTGKRILMKMDVEGSEWESLLRSPDEVLAAIDQLAIEFHEVEEKSYLSAVARLKQFFHVAHVHVNNYSCEPGFEPFPGQVFEALLVNKRIAQVDGSRKARAPSPLDAPNQPTAPDCQITPQGSELSRIQHWLQRKRSVWAGDWYDRLMPPY